MNFEPLHKTTSARLSHACRDMERKMRFQLTLTLIRRPPGRILSLIADRRAGSGGQDQSGWPSAGLRAGIAAMTKEYAAAGDSYYSLTG